MKQTDPLQEARDFLELHGGACSVERDSPMGVEFKVLEFYGEVIITLSETEGYINVRSAE